MCGCLKLTSSSLSSSTCLLLSLLSFSRTPSTRSSPTLTSSLVTRPRPPHSLSRTTSSPRTSRKSPRPLPTAPKRTPKGPGLLSSHRAPTRQSLSPRRKAARSTSGRFLSTPSVRRRSTTPMVLGTSHSHHLSTTYHANATLVMLSPVDLLQVSSRASPSRRPLIWASGLQSSPSRNLAPRTPSPSRHTPAKRRNRQCMSANARVFQQSARACIIT